MRLANLHRPKKVRDVTEKQQHRMVINYRKILFKNVIRHGRRQFVLFQKS